MVGDLEHVNPGNAAGEKDRVDALLDVAGEEEPLRAERPEEDDRHVVDARAGVGRLRRHRTRVGPQDAETDIVEAEPVTGAEPARPATLLREPRRPGTVAGARAAHPGFHHPADPISREQQGEPRDVVLVRVTEDEQVDPPIPRWQVGIERDEESVRLGSAVDEEARPAIAVDEDRVTLADVEHGDPYVTVRARRDDRPETPDADDEGDDSDPGGAPVRTTRGTSEPRWVCASSGWCARPDRSPLAHHRPRTATDRPSAVNEGPCAANGHSTGSRRDRSHREPRDGGGRDAQRRFQGDARERQGCRRPDDCDDEREGHPGGEPDEGREEGGCAEPGEAAADKGDRAGRHRRSDERHDAEVDERGDDRDPPEPEERDGEGREFGRERYPQRLAQPAGKPATTPAAEAIGERRRPGHESAGRRGGEGETGVRHEPGSGDHDPGDRPAEGDRGSARAPALARTEDDRRHDCRPKDRRRGAGERGVHGDRGERGHRPAAARPATEDRGDHGRDDRDVPAGNGDDVADACRDEGRREVAIDAVSQSDEDSGCQPCLRFRKCGGECRVARPADRLERRPGVAAVTDDREAVGPQRGVDAAPLEVSAVLVVRARVEAAVDGHAEPRSHDRIAGQGRRDEEWWRGPDLDRSDLLSVARRPDRDDPTLPCATVARAAGEARRWRVDAATDEDPDEHESEPDEERHAARVRRDTADRDPGDGRARGERRDEEADERDERWWNTDRPPADEGKRSEDGPDGDPAASRHQWTTTSGRSLSSVAEPTSLRVRRSSTEVNRAVSRAATIFAAVTGPMPGRVSSCSAVAELRSIGAVLDPPVVAGAALPPLRTSAGSSREGTRISSPSVTIRARLSSRSARPASTRGE